MPFIQLPGDSTGKLAETVTPSLSSAGSTMHREVMVVGDWNSSQLAPATSSGGLLVAVSNPSTAVTITNPSTAATVFQGTSPWVISGTVTAASTVATNPWSSAPVFNLPIVSASSGLVQLTSAPLVVVATSGGTFTVGTTGTLVIVSASSGLVQISGTVAILSASSGQVGTFASTSRQYLVFAFNSSSSNSFTTITTAPAVFYGWNVGNQGTSASASIKIFNTTSGTVGSTAQLQVTIPIPGGSVGAGNNLMLAQGVSCTGGISFLITANFAATSTGAVAAGDVVGSLYYNT